jgi:hypothetical protein
LNNFIKSLKSYVYKFIIYLLIFNFIYTLYFNIFHKRFKTDIKNKSARYVFFGSSRVFHSININIIDSDTEYYNMGLDGATPRDIFASLVIYLKSNEVPKRVFIQVDHQSASTDFRSLSKYNFLKFKHLSNSDLTEYYDIYDRILTYFPLYFASKYPALSWREIFRSAVKANKVVYDNFGFKSINGEFEVVGSRTPVLLNACWQENRWFKEIDKLCAKRGVGVVYFTSPYFCSKIIKKSSWNNYKDYSGLFNGRKDFFSDNIHLNVNGADSFTLFLMLDINK